ncbi:solute carrier organic anion transporter family member 6A1 [Carlito syrichta]|uniref:Solute carrier organic anion transporter family member n=1 Tax=Carlito syrichta TaxID=1868482 RepID=A0A1U7TBC7_CARSF|nr:solute carrier organic anion transporter family member 6A1 [Carlito syrichta]
MWKQRQKQPWTFSQGNRQPPAGTFASCPSRNGRSGSLGCRRPCGPPALRHPRPAGFRVDSGGPGSQGPGLAMSGSAAGRQGEQEETSSEEVELEAAQAQPVRGIKAKEAWEAWEKRRNPPYLLPATLIKFQSVRKKRTVKRTAPEKTPEGNGSLEGRCGWGCVAIPYCQRFNNIHCFMVFYCILHVSQGLVFGLTHVSIDDFQKEYTLKRIYNFVLISSYDISSGLVAIFVAFYGERKKIKWIAFSSFLIGFGSLLCAFPSVNDRNYKLKVEIEDICLATKPISDCPKSKSPFISKYLSFVILGQTVQGIAGMPLYILGTTFLDESVTTHSAGTYLGIADALSVLGYALGYVMGAPLVKAPETYTSEKSTKDNNANQQWIWTWWTSFLITSLIAWSTLIPLSCFPDNFPGTTKIKARKRKQLRLFDRKFKDRAFGTSIKDLCAATWILMKNPVFICLALSKATESLLNIGASEFLPIYIENQFMITPSLSTILAGLVLFPGSVFGHLLGGVIVSMLKMSCKALMRFIMITSTISLIPLGFTIFIHCNPVQFAGINENYDGTGQLGNLIAPCNAQCRCSSSFHSSICGRDDIEYFSPCFAGCTYHKISHKRKMYYNCSCIKAGLITTDEDGAFIDARPGKCDAKCYKLPLFIAFMFSTLVFSGFSGIPVTLAIIRTVPDKLRSLALGISYVILRMFGSIPGPLIFRMIGETSCTFRDSNQCGRTGRCWIHNKTNMAYLLVGICVLCKVCTITFTAIAFLQYKQLIKKSIATPEVSVKNLKIKKKGKN